MANDDKKKNDDKPELGGKAADLFFKSRNVLITGEINDKLAHKITTQLIALSEDSDAPINLFISSPGGHVESGDMVHDMIQFIKPTVRTVGSGWVASAGALIFVGAKKENRFCLPNTRFLLHEPRGGIGGTASDMWIQAEQIRIMRERFHKIFAEATGQTAEKIANDTERDFWLNTDEAIAYGLLGKVIRTAAELPK
ncbi:ATP-dependent Clp protease proteolytic subunit [Silicimonas algicola]|jgi:ATP-dependent Clp protease, protease subunit|uniref:ATP-dependent Clp protease proteolytic subunit n=1 Tax=Silicimonas algicola TaxID=1826607 RepID=A0A316GCR7_9RHOB|nr:ATP-dependent Clp protease proteolytic subunit [Silicimonas algicola]AZQ66047.1 ATP-dependent Clp protease proteolytic subunit [Silicimonas algicola]PWK58343.1 ATP-dependent Clp protease proteolytic subunit ClpP [Silicimonas algicola]